MAEGEIWRDPKGNPLKFQDGDYVRIDLTSGRHIFPFLEGYVRGYDLCGTGDAYEVAYELFKMGHNPLRWVKEEVLTPAPPLVPHEHRKAGSCGICGQETER